MQMDGYARIGFSKDGTEVVDIEQELKDEKKTKKKKDGNESESCDSASSHDEKPAKLPQNQLLSKGNFLQQQQHGNNDPIKKLRKPPTAKQSSSDNNVSKALQQKVPNEVFHGLQAEVKAKQPQTDNESNSDYDSEEENDKIVDDLADADKNIIKMKTQVSNYDFQQKQASPAKSDSKSKQALSVAASEHSSAKETQVTAFVEHQARGMEAFRNQSRMQSKLFRENFKKSDNQSSLGSVLAKQLSNIRQKNSRLNHLKFNRGTSRISGARSRFDGRSEYSSNLFSGSNLEDEDMAQLKEWVNKLA